MSGSDWDNSTDVYDLVSGIESHLTARSSRLIAVGFLRTIEHHVSSLHALRFLQALDAYARGTGTAEQLARWNPPADLWFTQTHTLSERATTLVWGCAFPRPGERPDAATNRIPLAPLTRGVPMTLASAAAGPTTGDTRPGSPWHRAFQEAWLAARAALADVVRCAIPNPARAVPFDAAWRTSTAAAVAAQARQTRDSGAMPILADALQDAGCSDDVLLTHLRGQARHHPCCWGVRVVLGD